jgi:arsenate reductase (thioredoxin)
MKSEMFFLFERFFRLELNQIRPVFGPTVAFVNHYAALHGLPVKGLSAGTVAGKELNPMAVKAMEELGISMEGQTPKLLTQEMIQPDTKVITMGCGVDAEACPAKFLVSEDWGLDDPAGQGLDVVRAIRDQINKKVMSFIHVP